MCIDPGVFLSLYAFARLSLKKCKHMSLCMSLRMCDYVRVCVCAHPVDHRFQFHTCLESTEIWNQFSFRKCFCLKRSRITSLGTPGTGLWNWDPERHIWHTFRDCSDGRSAGSTQPGSCGLVGMSQGVAREWTTHSRNLGQFDAAILTHLCATRATQGRKDESERPENATRQEL